MLLLQHVGHRLGQPRRLGVQLPQLVLRLSDLHLQLGHRCFLLRLQRLQLRQLGVKQIALFDLLGSSNLFLVAHFLQLVEIGGQPALDFARARTGHVEVGNPRDQIAQTLRLGKHDQHRAWRNIDCMA